MKPIVELDGTTGEGGGQLVRVAVGLAALTTQPVKIVNVRGNRQDNRGGGLKMQHVAAIQWLADATQAQVDGLFVGSKTLTFIPRRGPTELGTERTFDITAAGLNNANDPSSTLLVLQAILPFALFSANDAAEPLTLAIHGNTNVEWSPSYEYFDQVLAPTLHERFGIRIDRELGARGWSEDNSGETARGSIALTIYPVAKGGMIHYNPPSPPPAGWTYRSAASRRVETIYVSIVAPARCHEAVQGEIFRILGELFPNVDLQLRLLEDSASEARWSVLLVAEAGDGVRWVSDALWCLAGDNSNPTARTTSRAFIEQLADTVCRELHQETLLGGQVDVHLQDQLVVFQALCDGFSSFSRGGDEPTERASRTAGLEGTFRNYHTNAPFGHGSMHSQTARWVVSQMLPATEFYEDGDFIKGIGFFV